MQTTLLGLGTTELRALAQREGAPAYRGTQIAEWLYRRGARTFMEMASLPGELRARLESTCQVGRSSIVTQQTSKDGTVKLLLALRDGERIEAVGLPYADRVSCCVSTQVGCPIGWHQQLVPRLQLELRPPYPRMNQLKKLPKEKFQIGCKIPHQKRKQIPKVKP